MNDNWAYEYTKIYFEMNRRQIENTWMFSLGFISGAIGFWAFDRTFKHWDNIAKLADLFEDPLESLLNDDNINHKKS